ncbi:MAG: hypothetical protein ACO25B_05620 [Chitinophagaceae bacterium]
MKMITLAIMAFFLPVLLHAQDITGLWKGTLKNDSPGQLQEYEVYFIKEKGKFNGISHTWFQIDGEKYYGVKKLKVSVARDGKIVLLDDGLRENNYPFVDRNIKQLNILDLGSGTEPVLSGIFVTNCNRSYYEITGQVMLNRTTSYTSSDLLRILDKEKNGAGAITARKQP